MYDTNENNLKNIHFMFSVHSKLTSIVLKMLLIYHYLSILKFKIIIMLDLCFGIFQFYIVNFQKCIEN